MVRSVNKQEIFYVKHALTVLINNVCAIKYWHLNLGHSGGISDFKIIFWFSACLFLTWKLCFCFQHAYALELLKDQLKEGMKALDVGSGSGYLTVCFALMVGWSTLPSVLGVSTILSLIVFDSFWYCGDCYTKAFFFFPTSCSEKKSHFLVLLFLERNI